MTKFSHNFFPDCWTSVFLKIIESLSQCGTTRWFDANHLDKVGTRTLITTHHYRWTCRSTSSLLTFKYNGRLEANHHHFKSGICSNPTFVKTIIISNPYFPWGINSQFQNSSSSLKIAAGAGVVSVSADTLRGLSTSSKRSTRTFHISYSGGKKTDYNGRWLEARAFFFQTYVSLSKHTERIINFK